MTSAATLRVLAALLACVALSSAATHLERVDIVPGHENQCYVKDQDKFYDSGSTWTEPGCIRGICSGKGTMIERQSCGKVSCGPNLRLVEGDSDAPYPDCCPSGCVPVTPPAAAAGL
ncbi:uncharacterized protein LOC122389178 [Amphibalanus amphitrite]|uniref:uncharacterized protein LOC122389178 n=1 Tax=Amphibalanus amphitrite TaxID=1232801 RepID=UPI001C90CBAD|nr:uncharacterized protein LOC122389178 [Amphibalanus amphitrite]